MAKIGLTKLGLSKNTDIEKITWNDQEIEIKQYLPIEDKLSLIATIVNDSVDENNFYNPGRRYVYTILYMILFYTNITLTDKQKQDISKTYDLIVSSGLSSKIFENINPYEYQQINAWIDELMTSIYSYRTSALGILEAINDDYKDKEFKAEDIQNKLLENKEDIQALQSIMAKMG